MLLFLLENHVGYLLFESDLKNNHSRRVKACPRQSNDASAAGCVDFSLTLSLLSHPMHCRQVTRHDYSASILDAR